jgi:large subunit ribosomal protein L21
MPKFAVIKTGGKQYVVTPGTKLKIEKLPSSEGKIIFNEVLAVGDESSLKTGAPNISGAKVEGEFVREGRNEKVIIQSYHSKTRYRKKKGHRQPFTEVLIKEIKEK